MPRKASHTTGVPKEATHIRFMISDDEWYRLRVVVAEHGARRIAEFYRELFINEVDRRFARVKQRGIRENQPQPTGGSDTMKKHERNRTARKHERTRTAPKGAAADGEVHPVFIPTNRTERRPRERKAEAIVLADALDRLAAVLPPLAQVVEKADSNSRLDRIAFRRDELAGALRVVVRVLERAVRGGDVLRASLYIGTTPLWREDSIRGNSTRPGRR